jgi:hypothetical protein
MKTSQYVGAVVAALGVLAAGCNKDLTVVETLSTVSPSGTDANAGSWKMIVLTSASQFAVAPPPLGDASEIAAVKSAQASLTQAQRDSIEYWSAGGVLRWNQIMRGLIARWNLPPAPRDDGTYPAPSAANPTADPQFPFANPPYAARAYSYVSVAQFEALKAAWFFKYQYGRLAPTEVDSGVQALLPKSNVPSYPSEDAVVSAVTAELLKVFFPVAVAEIDAQALEHQQAAILGGRATASDVAAGVALGKAVAGAIRARLSSDGMAQAAGNPAIWQAFADKAAARGETPWKSMEDPPRPPMLAVFGQVKAWMMTPDDIVKERPGPPPSTSSAQMQQEVAEVRDAVENLTREQLAIATFWSDGLGTATPPGHWNSIAMEHIPGARWSEVRTARAFALLNMAMHDAAVGCWETKFFYFNPRPSQMDPDIKTSIGLPNFPSYTSGHSTFSAAAALVLSHLFPSASGRFNELKEEASISRLYGGIHYRSDIESGKDHGVRIGGYAVRFAQQDGAE